MYGKTLVWWMSVGGRIEQFKKEGYNVQKSVDVNLNWVFWGTFIKKSNASKE